MEVLSYLQINFRVKYFTFCAFCAFCARSSQPAPVQLPLDLRLYDRNPHDAAHGGQQADAEEDGADRLHLLVAHEVQHRHDDAHREQHPSHRHHDDRLPVQLLRHGRLVARQLGRRDAVRRRHLPHRRGDRRRGALLGGGDVERPLGNFRRRSAAPDDVVGGGKLGLSVGAVVLLRLVVLF